MNDRPAKNDPVLEPSRAEEPRERPAPRDQWIRSLAGEWSQLWQRAQRARVLTESR